MVLTAGVKNFPGVDHSLKRDLRNRVNLVSAAEAHILWKTRLGHHVQGNMRESLDAVPLGQDSICQLGSWINGSVLEPFCDPEVHRQLSEAHQQFHELGILIINKLKAGKRKEAEEIFKDDYSESLRNIVRGLTVINRQLQES